MSADPRIAALRKIARSAGWNVSSVTRAKRRAPIALVASRTYRDPWTPGNMTQHQTLERLEINVEEWTDAAGPQERIAARHSYWHRGPNYVDSIIGVEVIEAALRRPVPTEQLAEEGSR